jgi:proteic killer suppression protein
MKRRRAFRFAVVAAWSYLDEVYLYEVSYGMTIQRFANDLVQRFFETGEVNRRRGWFGASRAAARKLDMLDYAAALQDLMRPPANRIEALKGSLKGFYSVRVNDQWRVVFHWTPAGPTDVDVVDYH